MRTSKTRVLVILPVTAVFALAFAVILVMSIPPDRAQQLPEPRPIVPIVDWQDAVDRCPGVVLAEFMPPVRVQGHAWNITSALGEPVSIEVKFAFIQGRTDPVDNVTLRFGFDPSRSIMGQTYEGKDYILNKYFTWNVTELTLRSNESQIVTLTINVTEKLPFQPFRDWNLDPYINVFVVDPPVGVFIFNAGRVLQVVFV